MKLTKRTSAIELFDTTPVTDFDGEMSLLLSYMLTEGKKVQARYLTLGRGTVLQYSEAKRYLARQLDSMDHLISIHDPAAKERLIGWIAKSHFIETEPWNRATRADKPLGGFRLPSYLGLRFSNVGLIREKYWGAFVFLALASELELKRLHPPGNIDEMAAGLLDRFLREGTNVSSAAEGNHTLWTLEPTHSTESDSMLDPVLAGLLSGETDGPSDVFSLPHWRSTDKSLRHQGTHVVGQASKRSPIGFLAFMCPGSVILMKNALRAVLLQTDLARDRKFELLKTVFTLHIWLYYRRSLYVLNEIERLGTLPETCADCWKRFQDDLVPPYAAEGCPERYEKWAQGQYGAAGTEEDAQFVARTCPCPGLFFNMGTKECSHALRLSLTSLRGLYDELEAATLNRIWLGLLIERMSKSLRCHKRDLWPDRILAADSDVRQSVLVEHVTAWINELLSDGSLPESWQVAFTDIISPTSQASPEQVFRLVREYIADSLTQRDFSRYREVLHSMMGGGELPTNQNPRGVMSGAGPKGRQFYPTLQSHALELLVLLASDSRGPDGHLSFEQFIEFLQSRYGIYCHTIPGNLQQGTPLSLDACTESRNSLRERLRAAGFLREFSDTEEWNRVSWTRSS